MGPENGTGDEGSSQKERERHGRDGNKLHWKPQTHALSLEKEPSLLCQLHHSCQVLILHWSAGSGLAVME